MPPGVRIQKLDGDKGKQKLRQVVMDSAIPTPGVVFTHNNSKDNVLRGLCERLFYVARGPDFVPPPEATQFDLSDYGKALLRKMPKLVEPISADAFVALYDGPKRKRYEAAMRTLVDRDLESKDWEVKLFIKDEKICSWVKADPAPRLISPRSPEYCLELGRYIKPIEALLYKAVARVWGETTIAKGLNFNERGLLIQQKWESFDFPVAVGLDASRFDQHVSETALKWEHSVYNGVYCNRSKKLKFLLRKQLLNYGSVYVDDHKISYTHRGGRMSGDMNTALGNCLLMTGMVWTYARAMNINVKLINDGDDCVVFMESADLEKFTANLQEWFLGYGFSMKVETPVYNLEEIEFCQCHPVYNGEQYTMCRNLHKVLFTDGVHIGRTTDEIRAIRHSIYQSGLAWAKGIPVFNEFYKFLNPGLPPKQIRLWGEAMHSGTYWNAKGCVTGTEKITTEARLSFYKAFGLSETEQLAVEELYRQLPRPVIDGPHSVCEYSASCKHYPLFVCDSLNYLLFGETL